MMFGIFRGKEEKIAESIKAAVLATAHLDHALKAIESHWKLGHEREGEALLKPIVEIFSKAFGVLGEINESDSRRELIFYKAKQVLQFLRTHGRKDQLSTLLAAASKNAGRLSASELGQIKYFTDLLLADEGASSRGGVNERRIYYVCQRCGDPTLFLSKPCMWCGFKVATAEEVQYGTLLSSRVLLSPALFAIGQLLSSGSRKNPPLTLKDVWPHGSLDEVVKEQVGIRSNETQQVLTAAANDRSQFIEPIKQVRCTNCGHSNAIQTNVYEQPCIACGTQLAITQQRWVKACLRSVIRGVVFFADHQDTPEYANFIALLIQAAYNACILDQLPSDHEVNSIVSFCQKIKPITFCQGNGMLALADSQFIYTLVDEDNIEADECGVVADELNAFLKVMARKLSA